MSSRFSFFLKKDSIVSPTLPNVRVRAPAKP